MRCLLIVVLATFVGPACKSTEKKTRFEVKREWARSSVTYERRMAAGALSGNCCYPDGIDPSGRLGLKATQVAACGEVGRLLATEHENDVLEALIDSTNARCYRQFPASTLARLCTTSQCTMPIRRQLVNLLAFGDPDPEITKALLAQLVDSDDTIRTGVSLAVGGMGEADLWPAIDALASPDPVVRRAVAKGFAHLTHPRLGGLLELPALVPALVRATYDSDAEIATSARIALNAYHKWSELSPEQMVDHMERVTHQSVVARMLAVRRFSCRTEAAARVLSRLANAPQPNFGAAQDARDARDAIALRKRRCPRLVE